MAENEEAIKAWYAMRRATIHEVLSAYDVLRMHGVSFRHSTEREEQFSCPFHGKDEKPSARVYPTKGDSRSHVWCYVCKQSWDAISLWKKYSGEEKGHHRILTEIEKHLGLTPPQVPRGAIKAVIDDREKVNYLRFLDLCEHRIHAAREAYLARDDMNGFLIAGSILDKMVSRVADNRLSYAQAILMLKQLIDKIGERIRAEAHQTTDP